MWCYSGFTLQQLTAGNARCRTDCTDELLSLIDVLVDGPFVQAQKDISLRFRGSANPRLLDMPASLQAGEAVLWQDEAIFTSHQMPERSGWNRFHS